jgi:hypothetical protein
VDLSSGVPRFEGSAERCHTLDIGAAERDLDGGPLIDGAQLERVQGCRGRAVQDRGAAG